MVEGFADNWTNFPALLDGNYWSEKNTDAQNASAKYPRLSSTSRFYVSGNDLFTASKFPKGWDPEVATTGYPICREFLIGCNVKF